MANKPEGFVAYSAEQIFADHGITPRDADVIAEALGIRLPCSAQEKGKIAEFATVAKQQSMTIKQAIAALKPEEPQPAPQASAPNPAQTAPGVAFEYEQPKEFRVHVGSTTAQQQALLQQQRSRQQEAAEVFGVVQERLRKKARLTEIHNRLDALERGETEPENDFERQYVAACQVLDVGNEQCPLEGVSWSEEGVITLDLTPAPISLDLTPALQLMAATFQNDGKMPTLLQLPASQEIKITTSILEEPLSLQQLLPAAG